MERLSKVENGRVGGKGLGNGGTLSKETESDSPGKADSAVNSDTSSPQMEDYESLISYVDPFMFLSDDEETVGQQKKSENKSNSLLKNSTDTELDLGERSMIDSGLSGSEGSDAPPKANKKDSKIYKHPEYRSFFVEHNYCKDGKSGVGQLRLKIKKSTCLDLQSGKTFEFENRSESSEKRMGQQTIVLQNSITNHVDSDPNLRKGGTIKLRLRRRKTPGSKSEASDDSDLEDISGRRYLTPKIRIRRSWKRNGDYYDIIVEDEDSGPQQSTPDSDSGEIKKSSKKSPRRNSDSKSKRKLISPDDTFTVDGISYELLEVERIVPPETQARENMGTRNEVAPLILRKITTKDSSDPQKEEYVLAKPNATKSVPEDKNWNLEYMEDDVRNLGLDDLLLKASELNAENFTKALGQNSGGRNGNNGDSPEIVLSFPPSKREATEPLDGDNSKDVNIKRAKLEFLKKCVKDDKMMKPIEEEVKKAPEAPRRSGIKVKTVQNINEEFKDSLGAKLKKLEARDVTVESSIPVFTINDDLEKRNQTAEVFVPDGRDKVSETQSSLLTCRQVKKQIDVSKINDEIPEEARPYIMKLIQNKDSPAKDNTSAGSAPKVFAKPKSLLQEKGTFSPMNKDRRNDTAIKKIPERADSGAKSGGHVASEQRGFEVVNVGEYSDSNTKKTGINSHFVLNCASLSKKDKDGNNVINATMDSGSRKRHIPILLSSKKKYLRMPLPNSQKLLISPAEDANKRAATGSRPQNRAVSASADGGNNSREKSSFTIAGHRVIQKDAASGMAIGKYVQVVPNMVGPRGVQIRENNLQTGQKTIVEVGSQISHPRPQVMTLTAFANILRDILPDKWILSLDKKFGLQIIKTHLDECLNPSIMISVVVGRTGKVTVNVRGRQLEKSHDLFVGICDVGNSKEKISVNHILAIINKLRFFNVCFGCDDLSLKKYWSEDGFIEYYTEFQQTYRSHICESLVRLGRKRCHPCYRMQESLKKRRRREQLLKKAEAESSARSIENPRSGNYPMSNNLQGKGGVKRNVEEYLEDSFVRMKQNIIDEIERLTKEEENEKVPQTQDEVLGFMGLTRKDSLDVNVRKSKRERKGSRQYEPMLPTRVSKDELNFLYKHWQDINVLYSTSLLVGAYSRTGMGRLREKCKTFYGLLATWREIIRTNSVWVGGYMSLAENLVKDEQSVDSESVKEKFDRMDAPALRAYIINCVKEVNRMKTRLRTKNRYFRALYNTFLKPNMKRSKQSAETVGLSDVNMDLLAEKDLSRQESTPEIWKQLKVSTLTGRGSSGENYHRGNGSAPFASYGN